MKVAAGCSTKPSPKDIIMLPSSHPQDPGLRTLLKQRMGSAEQCASLELCRRKGPLALGQTPVPADTPKAGTLRAHSCIPP